jgi:hypothetical protein
MPVIVKSILRHASIQTTGDVDQQPIEKSVFEFVNSRIAAVFEGWTAPTDGLGLKGRKSRGPKAIW